MLSPTAPASKYAWIGQDDVVLPGWLTNFVWLLQYQQHAPKFGAFHRGRSENHTQTFRKKEFHHLCLLTTLFLSLSFIILVYCSCSQRRNLSTFFTTVEVSELLTSSYERNPCSISHQRLVSPLDLRSLRLIMNKMFSKMNQSAGTAANISLLIFTSLSLSVNSTAVKFN